MTINSLGDETQAPGAGPTRRSVVRVGAAAAWTVPLIQVATAAPALAVSGPADLDIKSLYLKRIEKRKSLQVYLGGIKNSGSSPAGQVTVVVRVPKTKRGSFSRRPWISRHPSTGWSFVGRTGDGPWDFTFISDQGVQPGGSTPYLLFWLGLNNNGKAERVTITATAFAQGATPDTASRTIR